MTSLANLAAAAAAVAFVAGLQDGTTQDVRAEGTGHGAGRTPSSKRSGERMQPRLRTPMAKAA